MTQWMRCYWDEEDTWFVVEIGDDGWVTRQVELQGPERVPINAASLQEWTEARETGRLREYEARYGLTAEGPISEWSGYTPEYLTAQEFTEVWTVAREHIEQRQT